MLSFLVQCRFQATCEAIVRTYSCVKVPITWQNFQPPMLILCSAVSFRATLAPPLLRALAFFSTTRDRPVYSCCFRLFVNLPPRGAAVFVGMHRANRSVGQMPMRHLWSAVHYGAAIWM